MVEVLDDGGVALRRRRAAACAGCAIECGVEGGWWLSQPGGGPTSIVVELPCGS
jgi:hypothetical protein